MWDTLVTQCSGTPFVGLVKHLYWTRLFKPLLKHEDMSYAPKRIICGVFAFSTLKKRGCLGKCVLKPYVSFGSLQPLLTWRVGSTIERTLSLCRLFKKNTHFSPANGRVLDSVVQSAANKVYHIKCRCFDDAQVQIDVIRADKRSQFGNAWCDFAVGVGLEHRSFTIGFVAGFLQVP